MRPSFHIVDGDPSSPCILHVPHAPAAIPEDVRAGIALDDHGLEIELRAMTDVYTDLIAARAADMAEGARPWSFVNGLSRLVVDPERFPDDREFMNTVGMGAVYTRTSAGAMLRDDDAEQRAELITAFFDPYAVALADLVDARLEVTSRALIIDIHSYPRDPNPYELHPHDPRPEVCLGFDDRHSPDWLRMQAHAGSGRAGRST